jgi:aspartyl-tRNA(Asn)/glutamyl-tRNA(Gln) amidotransferase subunit C
MTQITRDEVLKLASLSSLQLADDEIEGLQADIGAILDYVQQLDELDTSGVSPAYQVTGLQNVMRDDVVDTGEVGRDQLLALAPDVVSNQIKVPKVL